MQQSCHSFPRLEELETRRLPAVLGLSVGGIGGNLLLNPALEHALQPGLTGQAPLASVVAPAASFVPLGQLRSLDSPSLNPFSLFSSGFPGGSLGSNPVQNLVRQEVLNAFLNSLVQQVEQSSSGSGLGTPSPFTPATPAIGTQTPSQGQVPNFFLGFTENGSTGGQVAVQTGFGSLIPNYFFQNQTSNPAILLVGAPVNPPTPTTTVAPEPSVPLSLLFAYNGNLFLGNVGSGDAVLYEDEAEPAPRPEDAEIPANQAAALAPEQSADHFVLQELPLGPEVGLSLAGLPQVETPAEQTDPFWDSFAAEDHVSLLETVTPVLEERQVELGGMLAVFFLALVPDWVPRLEDREKDNKQRQEKKRTAQS